MIAIVPPRLESPSTNVQVSSLLEEYRNRLSPALGVPRSKGMLLASVTFSFVRADRVLETTWVAWSCEYLAPGVLFELRLLQKFVANDGS
jgi:hypothetical protein